MQIEITENLSLHDGKGHINKEGWAKKPYWIYDRNKIKASKFKIKEWDYYAIISQKNGYGLAFTISDMGYMGFSSITFFDFNNKYYKSADSLFFFPMGRLNLSPTSNKGKVEYKNKNLNISFKTSEFDSSRYIRQIVFSSDIMKDFFGNIGLDGTINLYSPKEEDTICIATSWKEKRTAFYYNQKINCMQAEGEFKIGNKVYKFNKEEDLGVLDWGRGVWTYKNRWFWSSLSTYIDGIRFGWNLGYGFSDRSSASENAIFYDGKIIKLDQVEFKYDSKDYLKNWKIIDNEGKIYIDFEPILDRNSKSDLILIKSIQHQVFGYFSGKVKISDDKILILNKVLGFAEDVFNVW